MIEAGPEIDVIEFLWASMALFDDGGPSPDVSETYRPRWRDLSSIPEARARILKWIAEAPDGLRFRLVNGRMKCLVSKG